MRWLALLLFLALPVVTRAQPYPSPILQSQSVLGSASIGGGLTVSGTINFSGGGTIGGTFSGPVTIKALTAGLANVTTAQLSSIPNPTSGYTVYVTDCQNGSQSFPGTGCPGFYNGSSWTTLPNPPTGTVTVGGQAIHIGGATSNQGNGSLIQTSSGTAGASGNCPQYNSGGALIDSGAPCGGGGGGSGTVTNQLQNTIPVYTSAGSSNNLGGMTIVNNAVVGTNGSGAPSEMTTLPAGLAIPTPTISGATLTGTTSIGNTTYTGKQTFLAATVNAASLNIPVGVAPTSPVNGDVWETSAGIFGRSNGVTVGPLLYQTSTTAPLTGGGVGPILTLACPQCATTTNGGALTGVLPMAISTSGAISLGCIVKPITWVADSTFTVHNDSYDLIEQWPPAGSCISGNNVVSMVFHTGGTGSPSFAATLQICTAGSCVNVPGCANVPVSSATNSVATCSAAVLTQNQTLKLVLSGVTGSPSSAVVQANVAFPSS